jgi:hypothetical protein
MAAHLNRVPVLEAAARARANLNHHRTVHTYGYSLKKAVKLKLVTISYTTGVPFRESHATVVKVNQLDKLIS